MIGFMQKKLYSIILIISIILISLTTVGFAYAWFVDLNQESVDLSGNSSGAYFYDGDGSQENPYLIADKRHMYNLVWLQNNGRLTDSEGNQKKYYFKLYDISSPNGINGNIDMSSIIIPPIGNDTYPFISEFDGNGCQINNLIVSTNFDVIYNGELLKNDSYKFSNSVGLFGLTGANSSVKNFILNNPTVEVYGDDNNYSTTASKVAGLAVGHVEAKASSIGVKGGALSVNRASYETFNSIIGYIKEGVGSDVVGGGSSSSSSPGTGGDVGQFIPDDFFEKLDFNTPYVTSDVASNTNPVWSNTKTLTLDTNIWLVPNPTNPTLGLGSFSFTTGAKSTTLNKSTLNSFVYYSGTMNESSSSAALDSGIPHYSASTSTATSITMSGYNTATEAQKNIMDKIKSGDVRKTSINSYLNWNNSPSTSLYSTNYTVYKEDGSTSAQDTTAYNVYSNSIKISVASPSPKIFVIASGGSDVRYLGVYKLSDKYGDYTQFKKTGGTINESEIFSKSEEGKYVKASSAVQALELPAGSGAVACEFDLSNSGPGTYMLASTKNSIKLYYLSVVGVTEGDTSSGLVDTTKGVSAIDFIYDGVTIAQAAVGEIAAYNFIYNNEAYEKSGTSIYFELSSSENKIVLYFKRELESNEILFKVQYNSKAPSASYASKVSIISGGPELIITSSGISSGGPTFT